MLMVIQTRNLLLGVGVVRLGYASLADITTLNVH